MNKNCIVLFTASLIFLSSFLCAQSWAAAGATWHYTAQLFTFSGYIKIEKTSDTLISGYTCDVLTKTRIGFNYLTSQNDSVLFGREYTRLSNDTVYTFRNNQFYVLYCLNANPGDTWVVAGNNVNCSPIDTITVDSVGTTMINSTPLRYTWTSMISPNGWRFTGKIVEKIGCIGYMFPEPTCVTDSEEGGPLRCYSDSTGWNYQTGIAPSCDYTTSVSDPTLPRLSISVVPNPFSSHPSFLICGNNGNDLSYAIKIYSEQGAEVLTIKGSDDSFTMNDESLSPGLYLWVATLNESELFSGKILKLNSE